MTTAQTMRNTLLAFVVVLISLPAIAQYDDVYYDPGKFRRTTSTTTTTTTYSNDAYAERDYTADSDFEPYDASNYDGEAFGYDDYSGYEYSSRIRRFRQPYAGFGYYDPVYVDQVYYGGFRPFGSTVLIYNSPYSYNNARFNRFNRFNRWNDPFYGGYAGYNRFNRWNDPFFDPYWNASPFGFNSGFGAGYNAGFYNGAVAGGYYCPPSWGNGAVYNTPNAVNTSSTRAGSRISGTRGTTGSPTTSGSRRYRDIDTRSGAGSSRNRTSTTRGTSTQPSRSRGTTTRPSRAAQRPSRGSSTSPSRQRTSPQRSSSRSSASPRSSSPRRSSSTYRPSRSSSSRSSASPSRSSSSRSSSSRGGSSRSSSSGSRAPSRGPR